MIKALCGFNNIKDRTASDLLITFGPTLFVDIGFDANYKLGVTPKPGITCVKALVDTGATESCIDNLLATTLKLPIIDKRPISGTIGKHETNIYLAQIHVPTLKFTIHGTFAGVNLKAGGQEHYALIGRTFLQHFTMVYEGLTGSVVLIKP